MTLEDTILALIPVAFGWFLGVISLGIPRFFGWIKAVRIKQRYFYIISQVMDTGITDAFFLLPSAMESGEVEKFDSNKLSDRDQKYLDKLEECVLYNKDWGAFERIIKFLDNKFNWGLV